MAIEEMANHLFLFFIHVLVAFAEVLQLHGWMLRALRPLRRREGLEPLVRPARALGAARRAVPELPIICNHYIITITVIFSICLIL